VAIATRHEVRELEATRLDALQAALWLDAMRGSWQAGQTVLKIMDQGAKLLGLHSAAMKKAPTFMPSAPGETAYGGALFDFAASLAPM